MSAPFPFSLYRGITTPQPNNPIDRRDLLDYNGSNIIQNSRYINPLTRDFEVSPTNLLQGQNAVDQQVLLALNTTFNSSAQAGFGQSISSTKLITSDIQNQITNSVQQTLSTLISGNYINIQSVLVNANNDLGQVNISVSYNNNTLGTTPTVSFIL
jgi:hypothetical protein